MEKNIKKIIEENSEIFKEEQTKARIIAIIKTILKSKDFKNSQPYKDTNDLISLERLFLKEKEPKFKYIDAIFWDDFVYIYNQKFFYNSKNVYREIIEHLENLI